MYVRVFGHLPIADISYNILNFKIDTILEYMAQTHNKIKNVQLLLCDRLWNGWVTQRETFKNSLLFIFYYVRQFEFCVRNSNCALSKAKEIPRLTQFDMCGNDKPYEIMQMVISFLILFMNLLCFRIQTMRKREYQSFTLKLGDLKEYEAAKNERMDNAAAAKGTDAPSNKFGPKSANEIRERIGLKSKSRSTDGV